MFTRFKGAYIITAVPNAFRIVLASASPRRRELLTLAGVPFVVVPSRVDEVPLPGEAPRRFARRAARDKGEEVARRRPEDWVLSADTIVAVGGTILGKPADRREAAEMLALLQGREHRVLTAVSLLCASRGYRDEVVESTRVRFRPLSAGEIRGYVATGEWDDKAGAYAVQGKGALLVEGVHGSFTNVVGLPVTRVIDLLVRAGVAHVADPGAAAAKEGADPSGGNRNSGWYRFGPVEER
jgi:septum formation protein